MHPRLLLLAGSLAGAVALAACSGGAAGAPASSPSPASDAGATAASPAGPSAAARPADQASLDGRSFVGSSVSGARLPSVSAIRVGFAGDRLSGTGGCNRMAGSWSIAAGVVKTGPLASTEMACADGLMQQDQWLASFLDGATATLDGPALTLAKGDTTLMLTDDEVANPDQPLEGTTWTLDGIIAEDAVSSVPAGVTATMTIGDGKVQLKPGCNSGMGTVTVAQATLTFGPIATTRMFCEGAPMEVETQVLAVLQGETTYTIDAGTLTIMHGAQGLTFKAGS